MTAPSEGVRLPLPALIGLCAVAGVMSISTFVLAISNSADIHRVAAPAPTQTVTVERTKVHNVSTGISTNDFDACASAYSQVLDLLGDQTTVLRNVSSAASQAVIAANGGDYATLDAITSQVQEYSSDEDTVVSKMGNVDGEACKR